MKKRIIITFYPEVGMKEKRNPQWGPGIKLIVFFTALLLLIFLYYIITAW